MKYYQCVSLLFAVTLVCLCINPTWGITINLKNRAIVPDRSTSLLNDNGIPLSKRLATDASLAAKRQFYVVSEAKGAAKKSLETTIGSQLNFLTDGAYLAYTTVEYMLQATEEYVTWVDEVQPQDKLQPSLDEAQPEQRKLEYVAILPPFPDFDNEEQGKKVAARLEYLLVNQALHCSVKAISKSKLVVKITPPPRVYVDEETEYFQRAKEAVINILSSQPDVHYIELRTPMKHMNKWASSVVQGGFFHNTQPMYTHGLTGKGQVVGIGDSGIDMGNCFFSDPNVPVPYNATNESHRKVISYWAYADEVDGEDGHGTHVAGSVAGYVEGNEPLDEYKGIAYESKIAFFDIGHTGSGGGLEVPDDLYEGFFPYFSGAPIITNSWGCGSSIPISCNSYTSMSLDVDKWMYENDEDLVLFAAGNSGSAGFYSVGSPATNKNGLSVGASVNQKDSWKTVCEHFQAGSCGTYTAVDREDLASFSSRGPTSGDNRIKPEVVAPGEYIISARGRWSNATVEACSDRICHSTLMENCLESDALTFMRGTSMATPVTAGVTALVRQWFTDGYYPTGTKNSADSMTPKGSTLKAMLIHSAVPLHGALDFGMWHWIDLPKELPNNFVGYGRVQLDTALKFEDSNFDIFISQTEELENGDSLSYCFTVTGNNTDFKATLAYTDPVGSLYAARTLVNDLDLIVVASDGQIHTKDDHDNTHEHVSVPVKTTGTFQVVIKGNFVASGPQGFSLVVSGQGMEKLEECDACPSNCNGKGVCNAGSCNCEEGWTGIDCSQESNRIPECTTIKRKISRNDIEYFEYKVPTIGAPFSFHVIKDFSAVVFISTSPDVSKTNYEWDLQTGYHLGIPGHELYEGQTLYIAMSSSSFSASSVEMLMFALPTEPVQIDRYLETTLCGATYYDNEMKYLVSYFKVSVDDTTRLQVEITPGTVQAFGGGSKGKLPGTSSATRDWSVSPTRTRSETLTEGDHYLGFYPSRGAGSFKVTLAIPEQCKGTQTLSQSRGTLYEHRGTRYSSYASNLNCIWLIQPQLGSEEKIHLKFDRFAVASGDKLIIHAGENKIGEFAGFELPPSIVSDTELKLQFTSDWFQEASGFVAKYTVVTNDGDPVFGESSSSSTAGSTTSSAVSSEASSSCECKCTCDSSSNHGTQGESGSRDVETESDDTGASPMPLPLRNAASCLNSPTLALSVLLIVILLDRKSVV